MPLPPWTNRDNFSTPAHQAIVDVVNEYDLLTVTGPLESISTPGGHVVADRRPLVVAEIIFGKVTDAGPNSEADFTDNRFWVKKEELVVPTTLANATTLTDDVSPDGDMLADNTGSPIVSKIVMATLPVTASGHSIPKDSIVLLIGFYPTGSANGSRDKRYMMIPIAAPLLVPVALTQNGGSNGGPSSPPTYTYDLKLFTTTKSGSVTAGSSTVGTAQAPMVPRPNGTFTAASLGLAIPATDGGFALLIAYEKPGTAGC